MHAGRPPRHALLGAEQQARDGLRPDGGAGQVHGARCRKGLPEDEFRLEEIVGDHRGTPGTSARVGKEMLQGHPRPRKRPAAGDAPHPPRDRCTLLSSDTEQEPR
ncbi:hypothetical protein GCM10009850_099020 [Nonomuraea monospora]|uniref:Uncharacterized protein n=1 Tax=Nonomuraea monospora TaxID=568818 RepID=A0ABN3CYU6_9ACTN